MSNEGNIVIPKEIAQGLASLNQDDLGVFFKQLLYCTGCCREEAKLNQDNIGGMTAFLVLRPLIRQANGFDAKEG